MTTTPVVDHPKRVRKPRPNLARNTDNDIDLTVQSVSQVRKGYVRVSSFPWEDQDIICRGRAAGKINGTKVMRTAIDKKGPLFVDPGMANAYVAAVKSARAVKEARNKPEDTLPPTPDKNDKVLSYDEMLETLSAKQLNIELIKTLRKLTSELNAH